MSFLYPPEQVLGKRASEEDLGVSRQEEVDAARKQTDQKRESWVHQKPRMRRRLFCCNCETLCGFKSRSACADCGHVRQQCVECLNGQFQHLEVKVDKSLKKEAQMRDDQSFMPVILICAWMTTANVDKTIAMNEGESIPIVLEDDYLQPCLFIYCETNGVNKVKLLNHTICGHSKCDITKIAEEVYETIIDMKEGEDRIRSTGSMTENVTFRIRLEGRFPAALVLKTCLKNLMRSPLSDIGRKQRMLSRTLEEACQQDARNDDKMEQDLGGVVNFLDKWYSLENCIGLAVEILDPFPKQIVSKLPAFNIQFFCQSAETDWTIFLLFESKQSLYAFAPPLTLQSSGQARYPDIGIEGKLRSGYYGVSLAVKEAGVELLKVLAGEIEVVST